MINYFDWPKDELGWAELLFRARDVAYEFRTIKNNSPFAGRVVVVANYYTTARYHGDVERFMQARGGIEIDITSSVIRNIIRERGFADAWNKYVLVFAGEDSRDVEVFHLGENKKP